MIGERIRLARKRAGMTQEELAGALGVKRSVVSKYETGAIIPNAVQIVTMCRILKVRADYLLEMEV